MNPNLSNLCEKSVHFTLYLKLINAVLIYKCLQAFKHTFFHCVELFASQCFSTPKHASCHFAIWWLWGIVRAGPHLIRPEQWRINNKQLWFIFELSPHSTTISTATQWDKLMDILSFSLKPLFLYYTNFHHVQSMKRLCNKNREFRLSKQIYKQFAFDELLNICIKSLGHW